METRERIISVAEELFSKHGYETASVRQITEKARVNVASINYHFGSKEGLLKELMRRRIVPMNKERFSLLRHFQEEAKGSPLRLERIFEAFLRPFFQTGAPGGRPDSVFMLLLGRAFSELPGLMGNVYEEYFKEIHTTFIAALRGSLPELSPEEVHWRYHFALSLMLASMSQRERIRQSSATYCDADDIEGMISRLIEFVCAGFRSSANEEEAAVALGRGE